MNRDVIECKACTRNNLIEIRTTTCGDRKRANNGRIAIRENPLGEMSLALCIGIADHLKFQFCQTTWGNSDIKRGDSRAHSGEWAGIFSQ